VLPLEPDAERAIAAVPAIEGTVADELAIAAPARPQPLQELINRPWLNVRGVAAGAIGPTAANVIPSRADAELDVRLVAGMDPQRTFAALRAHLAAEGWTVLDRPPTRAELRRHPRLLELRMLAGFPAARTPFADPLARTLIDCARRVAPGLVVEPTEGGSVPLHLFAALGIPVATLPTSNHDCNQHAADENLRLGDLFEAVDLFASVLLWDGGA
jgi:acetylornithine deacetylase/succinyl-diaminopimelate desuccinylase-like protein